MQQCFIVGNTDLTSYITSMKWGRNDIDAPGSGRDKSGTMRRGRVAIKIKLQLTCRVLSESEMATLNNAIAGETINVTYLDPLFGRRTSVFYGSSIESAVWQSQDDSTDWGGVSFNLVEV